MYNFLKKYRDNKVGAILIETALTLPLTLGVTIGIVEFGYIFFQNATAQKATQLGARLASSRGLVDITTMTDCFHDASDIDNVPSAGTDCSDAAVVADQSDIVCTNGATACVPAVFSDIVARMQEIYPNIEPQNVVITYSASGLGFIGRGKPVPAITVSVQNLQYNYIAIGSLYNAVSTAASGTPKTFATIVNLDSAQTTIVAEDLT